MCEQQYLLIKRFLAAIQVLHFATIEPSSRQIGLLRLLQICQIVQGFDFFGDSQELYGEADRG